jgi:RNA recognition motif
MCVHMSVSVGVSFPLSVHVMLRHFASPGTALMVFLARSRSPSCAAENGTMPKLKKKQRVEREVAALAVAPPPVEVEEVPPSNRLFVQNLPEECPELALSVLFQRFPGFKEVRMVPGKKGIAFVEFSTDVEAGVAMTGLQLFKITPDHMMQISYAK